MALALITPACHAQDSDKDGDKVTLELTLDKAIEIALSENPTIKVADKDVELKNIADKEAWQSLLPEVAINGGMTHTLLAAEMKLNGNSFKMGKDGTATGAALTTGTSFSFLVPNIAIVYTAFLSKLVLLNTLIYFTTRWDGVQVKQAPDFPLPASLVFGII